MERYKPYPEYKDSGMEWLGEIPAGWEITRLKFMSKIKNGQDYKAVEVSQGYPVIGSGGPFTYASCYMYDRESVLLGRKGTIDKPLYINEPFWTVDTMYYTEVKNTVNAKYLYYLATTIPFDKFSTNTALPSMTQENLSNHCFGVPQTYQEQTQIANFLDYETAKIDRLIEKQERLIELLLEKRQAVISHAVTKGLNPDAPMKDSGVEWLGEVPAHWNKSRLGFECYVKARLGWRGLKADEYVESGYIFLATPNIKDNEIDFDNVNYITKERYEESPEIMLKEGDVLVTKDGSTTGTSNIVRELPSPATVNSSIAVIRASEKLDPLFLFYFFRSEYIQNIITMMRGGMGVPHLFQADLKKFDLLLPPVAEQSNIASFVEQKVKQYEEVIVKANNTISLLQERRTALISAAVTGKIDLRNWQSPQGAH